MRKRQPYIPLLFVTIVLCFGFITMYINQSDFLNEAEQKIEKGTIISLEKGVNQKKLDTLLGNYINDTNDVRFITKKICDTINNGYVLPNLGNLNTKALQVTVAEASQYGGSLFKSRCNASKERLLGEDTSAVNTAEILYSNRKLLDSIPDSFPQSNGDEKITVKVTRKKAPQNFLHKICNIVGLGKKEPVDGVLVVLRQHSIIYDTVKENGFPKSEHGKIVIDSFSPPPRVLEYKFTDENGEVEFKTEKTTEDMAYSVVPFNPGFDYGKPQGTKKGKNKFHFTEKPDKITLFDTYTYRRLRDDGVLVVRTPKAYRENLTISFALFLALWWMVYYFVMLRDRKKKTKSDTLLLSILMTLTGLGLLSKFSIANPLRDMLLGWSTFVGTAVGILIFLFISRRDVLRFYNNGTSLFGVHIEFDFVMQFIRWANLPFGTKLKRCDSYIQKHIHNNIVQYFLKGLFLLVLLFLLPVIIIVKACFHIPQFISWANLPFGTKLKDCDSYIQRHVHNNIVQIILKVLFLCVWLVLLPVILFVKLITLVCVKLKIGHITLPYGIGYLILAFSLLVLLFLFGSGPEGSGAKVNLGPVQVSEVVKLLAMVFAATFFAENSELLQAFSEKQSFFKWKQMKLLGVLAVFVSVLMLFFMVLSDGGPAMVILVSFLLIYSVARRDTLQLFVGVTSFAILLRLAWLWQESYLIMAFVAVAWFLAWIIYSLARRKCIYESAIILNLILVIFIFGGKALEAVGFTSLGQRLDDRNAIVWSGVWDNDVKGGDQVAQGFWALASGGFSGQGLGKGHPNVTPAFHTDMILCSIGEQMGWAAIVLIVLCMSILLHRSLLIARKTGHPFTFYLAAGLAIVTGIQFLVIALGSLGLITLTGVTVPLLSKGNSSIIINLIIFGLIYSLSRQNATERQAQNIRKYDSVIAAGSLTFIVTGLIIVTYLFGKQVIQRDKILITPAYVTNKEGARVVEYNPRIDLLVRKLNAGNIYDRNGVLLATSDVSFISDSINYKAIKEAGIQDTDITKEISWPKRRYYPFGDHLFFMLGDFNTKVLWNNSDSDPYGYMAESRHLAMLRGFDNIKRDEHGRQEKATLEASQYEYSRYLKKHGKKSFTYKLYDYSALLPMLKAGDDSRKVREWNEARPERDIKLTIDAKLQVEMNKALCKFADSRKKANYFNYMRVSVVVLDAENGDLLCSANYPMPSQDTLKAMQERGILSYSDQKNNFKSYTDRDLGTTYQTRPGSTAKVISSMAGYMKLKKGASNVKYKIYPEEIFHPGDDGDAVSMRDAIVKSNNSYFINLVNDKDLYQQLSEIYRSAGLRIDREYYNNKTNRNEAEPLKTYFFFPSSMSDTNQFKGEVSNVRSLAIERYNKYIEKRKKSDYGKGPTYFEKMNWSDRAWAWGQGTLNASPLNIARIASIVVNDGTLAETRYLLPLDSNNDSLYNALTKTNFNRICEESLLSDLKEYMIEEAAKAFSNAKANKIGGKTGTPQRSLINYKHFNDAWYMFFVDREGVNQSKAKKLAVAVRIERSEKNSVLAKNELTKKYVIPCLINCEYMN